MYSPVIKGVPDLEMHSPSDGNGLMECNKCNVRRPFTATHCYDCEVCVDKVSRVVLADSLLYVIDLFMFPQMCSWITIALGQGSALAARI